MEMAGETLREIAVLVGVFFMLDNIIENAGHSIYTNLLVLTACIVTLALRMVIEDLRNEGMT
jgi:hypothetical protein